MILLQIFFKNRAVDEEGYVLFIRKNALQILIPKYGLEGTLYINKEKSGVTFTFNEEVCLLLLMKCFKIQINFATISTCTIRVYYALFAQLFIDFVTFV